MSEPDVASAPSSTIADAQKQDASKPVTATTTSTATSAASPSSTGELDFSLRPGGGPARPASYLSYISRPAAEATRRTYTRAFLLRYQPYCTQDSPELERWRQIIEGDVDKADKEPVREEKPVIAALPPRPPKPADDATKEKDATWREDAAKRSATQPAPKRKERPKLALRNVNDPALTPVIAMLNKITEDTFASLSTQILFFIETCNASLFKAVIKLIYDKAVSEPKFSRMYAQLCLMISEKCPEKTQVLKFRPILLSFCQEHFEKKVSPAEVIKTQRPTIDPAELEVLVKLRVLGNISFIASLYKAHFLPEKIVHQYVIQPLLKDILKSGIEEDIEALTRLLSLVGSDLDHPKAKNWIDQYFAKLQELARDARLPPRSRFMIMNVIDLRRHGWRTKTEAKSALILARHGSSISLTDLDSDDGPSLLRPTLAPAPTHFSTSPVSSPLASPAPDLRRTSDGLSSSSRSVKFAELPPAPARTISSEAIPFLRPATAKKPTSASSSPPSALPPPAAVSPLPSLTPLSPTPSSPSSSADPTTDRFDAQLRTILDEYLCSFDSDEAVLSLSELQRPDLLDRIVNRSVLLCMDRKEKYREEMQKLLTRLHSEGAIPSAAFLKGFGSIIRTLREIELDVPFAAQFVASFLGAARRDEILTEEELKSLVASVPEDKAAVLLSQVVPST